MYDKNIGYDLTRLKCRIDTKGGAQNLHKLIWKDIKTLVRLTSMINEQTSTLL